MGKHSSSIEKLTNLTVYSEALQERGLRMLIYVSDYYSCLATGGTLQELFIEIPLLVLMPRLVTKLNLVYSRSLETKPQEESLEGFKINFITLILWKLSHTFSS